MKVRLKVTALIFVCLLSVLLFACADGDIASLVPLREEIYLQIDKSFVIDDYVTVTGKGKLGYTVENPDVLRLDGNIVTGISEGTGYVTVTGGSASCRLKIIVIDSSVIKVNLSDATFAYDGEKKFPLLSGNLPDGATVKYYCDGEEFDGAALPGIYNIKVEVLPPEGMTVEYLSDEATLTVNKAVLDLSGVSFPSLTVPYDGQPKTLLLKGELPEGVTVRYENNTATDSGTYIAKAYLQADETIYVAPTPLTARLVITKKDFEFSYGDFETSSLSYDGKTHIPVINLPDGLNAEYYVYRQSAKEKYIPLEDYLSAYASEKPFVNSGTYILKAVFSSNEEYLKNYILPADKEIEIRIKKADFVNTLVWEDDGPFVYDGSPVTVGVGEGHSVRLIGKMPSGVNGEFPESVTVTFVYDKDKDTSIKGTTLDFTDAGRYTVKATFTMPSGYSVNYNPLSEMTYSFTISKAEYGKPFTFEPTDESGKDFSSPQGYDGFAHTFGLKFSSEEEETAFLTDVAVTYYYKLNRGEEISCDENPVSVIDAGEYVIGYRLAFRSESFGKNYILPENGEITVVITPVVYDMTKVVFADETVTYDGNAHSLEATGLPDDVSVEYEDNGQTVVGIYTVKATFSVAGMSKRNYVLQGINGEIDYLEAVLTINKAPSPIEEADLTVYSVTGGVYDPNKTLSDYAVQGPDSSVRWRYPTTTPVCNVAFYEAVYNPDSANYLDGYFDLALTVTPMALDGNLISVSDQFRPYTGKAVSPEIFYDGTSGGLFVSEYVCESGAVEEGKHILTDFKVTLKDPVNYSLENAPASSTLTLYIYNPNLYVYDGLRLTQYKGNQSVVSVPEGTESVYNGAFSGKGAVVSLTLPESLVSLSANSLTGLVSLAELTLPFLGRNKSEEGALKDVFGGAVPPSLARVTVTAMDHVPENAFFNDEFLLYVNFSMTVSAIGAHAFDGCLSLREASFPDVVSVGESAFRKCFSLERLVLPFVGYSAEEQGGVSLIFGSNGGENAYSDYRLKTFDLSSGKIVSLPERAFADMVSLETIIFPSSLRMIGRQAFSGIKAEITLNEYFTEITDGMFYGYLGTELVLPSTVTAIGREAFRNASNLKSLTLPASVRYISEYAFAGVKAEIVFAENSLYSAVEKRTFALYGGSYVGLPSTVTSIGDYAFEGSALTTVTLPSAVTELGDYVFYNCKSLSSATVETTYVSFRMFAGSEKLEKLTLKGVTTIENYAFENCVKLLTVAFDESLEKIGDYAFAGCYALSVVSFASSEAPVFGTSPFPTSQKIGVYVPEVALSQYKTLLEIYSNISVYKAG